MALTDTFIRHVKHIGAPTGDKQTVSNEWLAKTKSSRAASTQAKITSWLENHVSSLIGKMPISTLGPRDILANAQKIAARGAVVSAHRDKQLCGQVFRYAMAIGVAEREVTMDLKGTLSVAKRKNFAAITDHQETAIQLKAIHSYSGHPFAVAALKLSPLFFVRPGKLR